MVVVRGVILTGLGLVLVVTPSRTTSAMTELRSALTKYNALAQ